MKRVLICTALVVSVLFAMAFVVQASTPDEAKALAEKGAEFWKANGKEATIAEVNNQKGKFVKGDLYLWISESGKVLAHGGNASLVGVTLGIKEFQDTLKKGGGFVDYMWSNPTTKKVQKKTAFIKVIDANTYIGCSVYKKD
jgi:cytochrome c